MNILVMYGIGNSKIRKTISDSLFCFSAYDKSNTYYYFNIGCDVILKKLIDPKMELPNFSAIIIHYSAIAYRYDSMWWNKNKNILISFLKRYNCTKIIIPQDEYNETGALNDFIKDSGIKFIFTCASKDDYEKLYPKELGYEYIETVFTGYVNENDLEMINKKKKNHYERPIDLGYRARKLPYWLGRHGQLKFELANHFLKYLNNNDTNLKYDISNNGIKSNDVFLGNDWIEFLLNCRTMLGCLGGSGLVDWGGALQKM